MDHPGAEGEKEEGRKEEGRREGGREEGEEGRGVKERIKGDYFSQNAKKNLNNSNKNKNNFPLEIQDRC